MQYNPTLSIGLEDNLFPSSFYITPEALEYIHHEIFHRSWTYVYKWVTQNRDGTIYLWSNRPKTGMLYVWVAGNKRYYCHGMGPYEQVIDNQDWRNAIVGTWEIVCLDCKVPLVLGDGYRVCNSCASRIFVEWPHA